MATPVIASNSESVKVRYKDLDLAKTADVQKLRDRVSHAANKVCADGRATECVRGAIAGAEPQITVAMNTALHSKADSIAVSAH